MLKLSKLTKNTSWLIILHLSLKQYLVNQHQERRLHVRVCVYACVCVETYLERNCTAIHMPAYMRPLISQESISRSAMKPTSQMTTKGVPSITFCLNSCGRDRGRRQMDTDGKSGEIEGKTRK